MALAIAFFLGCTLSADAFVHPSPSASVATFGRAIAELRAVSKSRDVELAKLCDGLGVSHAKVLELLANQRKKLNGADTAKARHIDWLLDVDVDSPKRKKPVATEKAIRGIPKQNKGVGNKVGNQTAKAKSAPITRSSVDNDGISLFAQREDIHSNTKRALAQMGLTSMTEIQARTYDAALSGKDVLGRARTGTGKTVAFLLPAIERLLRSEDYNEETDVGILVISPTRELAMQIGDEAEKLLAFHKGMTVQVAYGGTKTARDISRLKSRMPTVLVATPGRLKDLLQTASVGGGTKLSKIMKRTPLVVLDETDSLLDMGFRREILAILNFLPKSSDRQTLLFSATVPKELKEIMYQTMKRDYIEVDCIQDGGKDAESTQTHIHVEQSHGIVSSTSQLVPSTIRVVKEALKDEGPHKVVVFFPTARMVSFFADLFTEVVQMNIPVLELHSKKSQGYRNRVSSEFRGASEGVLFTSDVSARGVDYPGVTHVIQFGMPSSREQYVHRLGRTGRGGAGGKGWLILAPFESLFLEELKGINVPKNPELIELFNKAELDETDSLMQDLLARVQNGDKTLVKSGEGAYQAFLGYYLGQMKRVKMKRKERLVDIANEFSGSMGFRSPPKLGRNMVKKMGLDGVAGLLVSGDGGKRGPANGGRSDHRDGRRSKPKSRRPKR
ncbi:hypothetical protein ACHAXT_007570 [Thalassiosira profunda]